MLGALAPLAIAGGAFAGKSTGSATAPAPPSTGDTPTEAGSFEIAPVRILGIPVFPVTSPSLGSGTAGHPTAVQRARVIEGNMALLYRPPHLCSTGEWLAEQLLQAAFLRDGANPCSDQRLGLRGPAEALRVEAVPQAGGDVVLQASEPGRERPLPVLTVTQEDARLYGTTTERLARRWRSVLERRLRYARRILTPTELWRRWRRVAVIELALGTLLLGVLALWRRSRGRIVPPSEEKGHALGTRRNLRLQQGRGLRGLLFVLALALLVTMAGVATFAVPGEVPLALDLLLLPLGVLLKVAVVALVALLLRLLGRFLLSQWASARADLPEERRARRDQRHHSLQLMSRRLISLAGCAVVALWVVSGIPGVRELSASAVLASGALLGALALVFQGLLRDFVAGLVVLLDDRYAIGDSVDLGGLSGEVVDIGMLSTELRGADQRVVTVPNSRCEPVVNHTKLHSGAELKLPLAPGGLDLPRALALVREETSAFAADPAWQPLLLKAPQVRGVSEVTVDAVWLSVLLVTATGRQGGARRELLQRLVERLGQEGISLASTAG
ncbi:MAG: hypothetical protein ER33_00460 [Cyanobium sp. CACIAM 14]|nr:MAG: hypothetical protein ER33_00460 [Cyanobium sp. CACIAM 14]